MYRPCNRKRPLRFEPCEHRRLLAADWLDVNNDGLVTSLDALVVINDLYTSGARRFDPFQTPDQHWLDVNFDGLVTPLDALKVIGDLNANGAHPVSFPPHVDVLIDEVPSATSAVENQDGVVLLRGEAITIGQDALWVHLDVDVSIPPDIAQFRLSVDTDGDHAVDTAVATSATGSFDLPGVLLHPETSVTFEVTGRIASTVLPGDVRASIIGIDAEDLETGAPATTAIVGTNNRVVSVSPHGVVFVLTDADVNPRHVLAGSVEQPAMIGTLTAIGEPVRVAKMRFAITGENRSLDRLLIRNRFGETLAAAVRTEPGVFVADGTWIVNTFENFTVHPVLRSDSEGAVEGDVFVMKLDRVTVVGLTSSDAWDSQDLNPQASSTQQVVFAKVASVTNASPDADGTAIPTGVRGIGRFAMTAAPHRNTLNGLDDVVLDQLAFVVEARNVTLDAFSFRVFNNADPTQTAVCSAAPLSSSVYGVLCGSLATGSVDTVIDAGATATFSLQATVLNPKVDPTQDSSLHVAASFGEDFHWRTRDAVHDRIFSGADLDDVLSTCYMA